MRLPEIGVAVDLTLCSELQSRPLPLWRALFSGKGGTCPSATHPADACAFSPWERVPVPLVLNTPFRHAFVESWLNSKLHNPQNVMAFYDLKQMFDSVARIALPLWLSYFAKNYHFENVSPLILSVGGGDCHLHS